MKPGLEVGDVLRTALPPRLNRPLMPAVPRTHTLGHHLALLVQASDLDELVPRVVRAAQELCQTRTAFLVLADPVAQHLDWTTARTESGPVRSALVRDFVSAEALESHLVRGLHVRPDLRDGPWLVVPLVLGSRLQGALAVVLSPASVSAARALDTLRDLCEHATPLLARVREMGELRATVAGLTHLVHEGAACEQRLADARKELGFCRQREAARQHLLGTVNHAFRTPLVALRGYARLLSGSLVDRATASEKQYLDVITRNVERLIEISRNLWEPPRVPLQCAPLDLAQICREAVAGIEPRAREQGVALEALLPETPALWWADGARLAPAIGELLSSVVAATPRGGLVRASLMSGDRQTQFVLTSAGGDAGADRTQAGALSFTDRAFDVAREAANLHGGYVVVLREGGEDRVTLLLPRLSDVALEMETHG